MKDYAATRSRKKSNQVKKNSFGLVWFGLAMVLVSAVITFKFFSQSAKHGPSSILEPTKLTPTPTPIPPKTFLLLGYGGGSHDGGKLTDTILEAYVEPEKKQVALISVPRDLWVKIPGTNKSAKINYAYASQGLNGAKQAVGSVTGIMPDYAAAVDFSGFIKLLKKFEPIVVDVPYTFTDSFYPILGKEKDTCGLSDAQVKNLTRQYSGYKLETQFPCRYETISFKKGKTKMTAEQALKFVRSRHGNDGKGDFGRSQRQQALIIAAKNKLLQPAFWPKIPGVIKEAIQLIDTDLTTDEAINYIKLIGSPSNLKGWQFKTIVLDTTNVLANGRSAGGAFILQPVTNVAAIQKLKNYVGATMSAQVKPVSNGDPFANIKQFISLSLLSFQITPTPTPTLEASASTSATNTNP